MTDLERDEVIQDPKGNHYRFVCTAKDEEEAKRLCEQMADHGYRPATFVREDNKVVEIFAQFSLGEEILWLLKTANCDKCDRPDTDCDPDICKVKAHIDDTNWKERLGTPYYKLLVYKFNKLKETNGEVK